MYLGLLLRDFHLASARLGRTPQPQFDLFTIVLAQPGMLAVLVLKEFNRKPENDIGRRLQDVLGRGHLLSAVRAGRGHRKLRLVVHDSEFAHDRHA